MIVCSKRGPRMATSRGCWLRLQIPARLGACVVLNSSAFATLSCSVLSKDPFEDVGTALVSDTVCFASRWTGSLAGTWSEVVGVEAYVARRRGAALRARRLRRVRENIGAVRGVVLVQTTCAMADDVLPLDGHEVEPRASCQDPIM